MTNTGPVRSGHELDPLFRPKSMALVGASERSPWSQLIMKSLRDYAFPGKIHLVNRKGGPTFGYEAVTSCWAIGEPVDLAFVFVPVDTIKDTLEDIAAAGIRFACVLTSGFAETGAEGKALEQDVVALAEKRGVRLLGPNCLGFVNYLEKTPVTPVQACLPIIPGAVALVSQSGAIGSYMASFAHQQGIGLSFLVSSGNEAQIDTAAIIDFLLADPATKVIALFAEAIRDPAGFLRSVERAKAAGKPIVIFKVGKGELTAHVAQTHTGALVGDDKVFSAVCKQYGVIRVDSGEDLMITAGLLAHTGALKKPGIGLISISGGACEIAADCAEEAGISLPSFSPATVEGLRAVIPTQPGSHNPFDVTGVAVVIDQIFEDTLKLLARDPEIGFTACIYDIPRSPEDLVNKGALTCIGNGLKEAATPGILINPMSRPITSFSREIAAETGIPYCSGGIEHTLRALGRVSDWSRFTKRAATPSRPIPKVSGQKPVSERETLAYLHDWDVPVIPAILAKTSAEAVQIASGLGVPVALKIASPDILHKTEVGGVLLGLDGTEAVSGGFEKIMRSAQAAMPSARLDGVVVAPMRRNGLELLVGIVADPLWGPCLTVGMGGVMVEVLADTAIRLLPAHESDIVEMLRSLRAAPLFKGFRGGPPVDLDKLAGVIARIADAALSLGPDLQSLEVNPLFVGDGVIESLDALAIWKTA